MYETYIKLSSNELHNRLTERNLHPAEIERIKGEVSSLKETLRVTRITRTQRKAEWDKVLQPLRYEINNARVGMRYGGEKSPQAERTLAFGEYIRIMEKLVAMLDAPYKALDHTPIQLARDKGLPNDGEHWTDWIPARVKDKVSLLFADVPVVPRGKRKIPFQRTMLPHQHETAKVRLLTKTKKEMENLEKQTHINATDARLEKLTKIKRALKIIEELGNNEAVPATWTKLNLGGD
jgi:hypothetical protein